MSKTRQAELSAVNFGHFGTPKYDRNKKSWVFSKINDSSVVGPIDASHFRSILPATTVSTQEQFLRDTTKVRGERYDYALRDEIRHIVTAYPELQPAEGVIEPLVRLSEAISKAVSQYDPARGSLTSFGSFTTGETALGERLQVLAIPGGECGETLRIVQLHPQKYAVHDADELELALPTEEIGCWMGKGAPILQVACSSPSLGNVGHPLFGVRLQGSTCIVMPKGRQQPPPAFGVELSSPQSPSRLDLRVLCEIGTTYTRGIAHADLVFHPDNWSRFLLISQAGQWVLFEIDERSLLRDMGSTVARFTVILDGTLTDMKATQRRTRQTKDAGDPESTTYMPKDEVVKLGVESAGPAARSSKQAATPLKRLTGADLDEFTNAMFNQMKTKPSSSLDNVDDGQEAISAPSVVKHDGWARVIWLLRSRIIIACTRREIAIFDMSTGKQYPLPRLLPKSRKHGGWFLDISVCERHADHFFLLTSNSVSLVKITAAAENGGSSTPRYAGAILLSTSHYREFTDTSIRFNVATAKDGYLITVYSQHSSLVTCFRFHFGLTAISGVMVSEPMSLNIPTRVHTTPIQLNIFSQSITSRRHPLGQKGGAEWYALQVIGRDLAIRSAIFSVQGICEPREHSITGRRQGLTAGATRGDLNISHDNLSSTSIAALRPAQQVHGLTGGQIEEQDRMLHFGKAANIAGGLSKDHNHAGVETISPTMISDVVSTTMNQAWTEPYEQRTLFELMGDCIPQIGSLNAAAETFRTMLQRTSQAGSTQLAVHSKLLRIPSSLCQGPSNPDLGDLVDRLESNYLQPLDTRFDQTFLTGRKSALRAIASEILLGSGKIEVLGTSSQEQDHEPNGSPAQAVLQSSKSTPGLERASSPEHERSSTPGVMPATPSVHSPYATSVTQSMERVLQRLKPTTLHSETAAAEWALRPMVLIDHWDIGADPSSYKYTITRARLEAEQDWYRLSRKEQRKKLKARERDQKRMGRELRKSQFLSQDSSQAPSILASSQQIPALANSSQVPGAGSSQIPGLVMGTGQVPPTTQSSQRQGPPVKSGHMPGFGSQRRSQDRKQRGKSRQASEGLDLPDDFQQGRPATSLRRNTSDLDVRQPFLPSSPPSVPLTSVALQGSNGATDATSHVSEPHALDAKVEMRSSEAVRQPHGLPYLSSVAGPSHLPLSSSHHILGESPLFSSQVPPPSGQGVSLERQRQPDFGAMSAQFPPPSSQNAPVSSQVPLSYHQQGLQARSSQVQKARKKRRTEGF